MPQLARSLHMPTRMSAQRTWAAALLGAALTISSSALAQGTAGTTSISLGGAVTVIPLMIGDQSVNALAQTYLGISECLADVPLTFRLDNLNMIAPSLDIYLGDGCNSTNRIATTTTACTYIKTVATNDVMSNLVVPLQASELVSNCMGNLESMPTLWFLEVSTPHGADDVGTAYGAYNLLNIDTLPPTAPSGLTGGEGGSEIPIQWKSGDPHLQGFVVFIDTTGTSAATGASAGDSGVASSSADEDGGVPIRVSFADAGTGSSSGACGVTQLVAGADPTNLPSEVHRKSVNERTASGVNLIPTDLAGAKVASIAVSAVDLAGNQGPLSNVACVKIVPTTGFLDLYRANGGTAQTGCPCSAMGPVQAEEAWPVGLAVLALGLSRRKRWS